ncbi:MAG: hypothetical protein HC883_01765 [Bdellovibrionaceae bacterium]|nr:hypothetical protein [Pseudobdellovibrionaceae bacterium]
MVRKLFFSLFLFWSFSGYAQESITLDFTNPSDYPGYSNFDPNDPNQFIGGYTGPYSEASPIQGPITVNANGYYCYPADMDGGPDAMVRQG